RAFDHRVRFIRRVPVLANVDRFRSANQQTCCMCFWIDMQKTNLRRVRAEIGENLVPFEISQILELGGDCYRLRRIRSRCCLRESIPTKACEHGYNKREIKLRFHSSDLDDH